MYCAAFCASAVALLLGSGYNASCHGLKCNVLAMIGNSGRLEGTGECYLVDSFILEQA